MIPPRSSATASAARNTFRPIGTLLLKTESTPRENAMSVAIGMASPLCMAASPGHVSQKSRTGTTIPPQAPMIGSRAFSRVESSPTRISLLISRPTDRKKIAIRKSLMTAIRVIGWPLWLNRLKFPIETETLCCQREKYQSLTTGMFAQMSAKTVQTISTMLEETWSLCLLRKLKFVVITYFI